MKKMAKRKIIKTAKPDSRWLDDRRPPMCVGTAESLEAHLQAVYGPAIDYENKLRGEL